MVNTLKINHFSLIHNICRMTVTQYEIKNIIFRGSLVLPRCNQNLLYNPSICILMVYGVSCEVWSTGDEVRCRRKCCLIPGIFREVVLLIFRSTWGTRLDGDRSDYKYNSACRVQWRWKSVSLFAGGIYMGGPAINTNIIPGSLGTSRWIFE